LRVIRTVPHEDCQALRLTPEQFAALCAANPSAVLEPELQLGLSELWEI
jgi:hypothetical protein